MNLWIVGKISKYNPLQWELQGVFDNEHKAKSICKNTLWFIGPITLNEECPEEPTIWPGAYYPKLEVKEKKQ